MSEPASPAQADDRVPWHARSATTAASELGVDPAAGLAATAAAARLARHGPNQLVGKAPRPAWQKLLDQFRSFLVLVLLGAAILAAMLGDVEDAVVIAIVVILNATLGFLQEHRAEAALAALQSEFFTNGKLWLALAGVVALQVVAVHWGPAQAVFDTVDLSLDDWLLATAIASTTLLLEEARKLLIVIGGALSAKIENALGHT
ncbi:cation-transporting P-type ATPase [Accumulibacter sp.]|uniref:cation-transporting P-type ATPase n=1 Tax=Accumulibacter sp. TaxID=2053492 RepID=UPI0025D697C6|nr:cation-transporting P-type ATPase [Accumulibacter sp.]MCM8611266.1 cation-transporting P-type ATPase [Accumulibacter sp.]MCM8635321.1 cation-transporting P-type ATPase [Accumulibacter sp.]MCM8638748.1 cation-transporting P-type ATPase [Accumulibacter sp.]